MKCTARGLHKKIIAWVEEKKGMSQVESLPRVTLDKNQIYYMIQ